MEGNKKGLNKSEIYISPIIGGVKMRALTKKLLLATVGGGLIVLGFLSAYNGLSANSPIYGIPAVVFVAGGSFALWKAFN